MAMIKTEPKDLSKPEHIRENKSKIWMAAIKPLGRIDPIFPFGKVYQFKENVYSILEESFDGHGDVWMHLIVGPEKAMLIDCGFGIGNLRGLVEKLLAGKPYIVVNTHPHLDHCFGDCQFDEVFCHEYAVERLNSQTPKQWDGLVDEQGKGLHRDFTRADIIPFKRFKAIGCKNHTIFNLGGDYDVEMIFIPGHDPAHVCFLDRKDRILYTGDSLLYVAGMGYNPRRDFALMDRGWNCTVEAFRNELEKLVQRVDEFDELFMSHMVLGESKQLVLDMFTAADAVVKDPDCNNFIHHDQRNGCVNKVKEVGLASVEYTDSRIYIADAMQHRRENGIQD